MYPMRKSNGSRIASQFLNAGGAFDLQSDGCRPGAAAVMLGNRTVVLPLEEAVALIESTVASDFLRTTGDRRPNCQLSMDPNTVMRYDLETDFDTGTSEGFVTTRPSTEDSCWRIPFHHQPWMQIRRFRRMADEKDNVVLGIARFLATRSNREEWRC
jgi:hypothetical protein